MKKLYLVLGLVLLASTVSAADVALMLDNGMVIVAQSDKVADNFAQHDNAVIVYPYGPYAFLLGNSIYAKIGNFMQSLMGAAPASKVATIPYDAAPVTE